MNKILIVILLFVSITLFNGCQTEEASDRYYSEKPYLSLSPNVDFKQLSNADLKIVFEAFARLTIEENEYGLYEITQKNGSEISISEELFDYFQFIQQNTNEIYLSDINLVRKRTLTRQEVSGAGNTDCVAKSLAYATGKSYVEIDFWITNRYGNNGVPSDQFYTVMNEFNDGAQVSLSMFSRMNVTVPKEYIIVINLTHAVTLECKTDNSIMYWDAQLNRRGFCTFADVTHVYELR